MGSGHMLHIGLQIGILVHMRFLHCISEQLLCLITKYGLLRWIIKPSGGSVSFAARCFWTSRVITLVVIDSIYEWSPKLLGITATMFQAVAGMNSYGMRLVIQVAMPGPAMVTLSSLSKCCNDFSSCFKPCQLSNWLFVAGCCSLSYFQIMHYYRGHISGL